VQSSAKTRHLIGLVLLFTTAAPSGADSRIQRIDDEVQRIERSMEQLVETSENDCQDATCVKTLSYWDQKGRIRKVIEELRSETGPGSITGRYYDDCRLILARSAPARTAKPLPESIEKYYFRKGKLLRVEYGGKPQTFPPEQWAYYERTVNVSPAECVKKPEMK
jgi:hypothetical protein